jgi:Activator of Hsp90 ATPase homolog 1-like protein
VRRWFGPSHEGLPGEVRANHPHRLLELEWEGDGEASIVRFELTEDERGTVLVLDHSLIDEAVGMAYLQRWTHALDRLDAEVER